MALLEAAKNGRTAIASLLLDHGADLAASSMSRYDVSGAHWRMPTGAGMSRWGQRAMPRSSRHSRDHLLACAVEEDGAALGVRAQPHRDSGDAAVSRGGHGDQGLGETEMQDSELARPTSPRVSVTGGTVGLMR